MPKNIKKTVKRAKKIAKRSSRSSKINLAKAKIRRAVGKASKKIRKAVKVKSQLTPAERVEFKRIKKKRGHTSFLKSRFLKGKRSFEAEKTAARQNVAIKKKKKKK